LTAQSELDSAVTVVKREGLSPISLPLDGKRAIHLKSQIGVDYKCEYSQKNLE